MVQSHSSQLQRLHFDPDIRLLLMWLLFMVIIKATIQLVTVISLGIIHLPGQLHTLLRINYSGLHDQRPYSYNRGNYQKVPSLGGVLHKSPQLWRRAPTKLTRPRVSKKIFFCKISPFVKYLDFTDVSLVTEEGADTGDVLPCSIMIS